MTEQDTGIEASPAARELAQDEGVDLSEVHPTGAGGRVLKKDVERHVETDELEPVPGELGGKTYWSCPARNCPTDDWSRLVIEAHIRKRHGA